MAVNSLDGPFIFVLMHKCKLPLPIPNTLLTGSDVLCTLHVTDKIKQMMLSAIIAHCKETIMQIPSSPSLASAFKAKPNYKHFFGSTTLWNEIKLCR